MLLISGEQGILHVHRWINTFFHLNEATNPCQNVSFPNGTQFDNRRASSGLLRRPSSQKREAITILNFKS
jgi:hypothetical protein